MKYPIIILLLLIVSGLEGQVPLSFERTYGGIDDDFGIHACPAPGDRYIIAGSTTNFWSGDKDSYFLCTDQNGNIIWTHSIACQQSDDRGLTAIPALDGAYVFAASSGLLPAMGGLIRYTSAGDSTWGYWYFGSSGGDFPGHAVQTPDSGFAICGYGYSLKSEGLWGSQMFIEKAGKSGSSLWRKTFPSSGSDLGTGLDNTPDRGFIVCGKKDSQGDNADAWLVKTDSAGNKTWEKFYGNSNTYETAASVRNLPSGGYILCGTWYSSFITMGGDFYVVKTDDAGNQLWAKKYGGTGDDRGISVDQTSDGGFIVLGESDSYSQVAGDYNLLLIRLDQNGTKLWQKSFGGPFPEGAGSVCQTMDGGFLVCGYTRSSGQGGADVYLIKTDENGVVTSTPGSSGTRNRLQITPNPVTGPFTFVSPGDVRSYQVLDVTGSVLLSGGQIRVGARVRIDPGSCPAGIYFLRIYTSNGTLTEKLIKTR